MPLEREAETYRREVGRLLAEGHAGRHALIKGGEVVSIWDTQRDALQAGCEKFGLDPFAVVKIDARDPERPSLDRRSESEPAMPSMLTAEPIFIGPFPIASSCTPRARVPSTDRNRVATAP